VPVGVPVPGATSETVAVCVSVPAVAERFDDVRPTVIADRRFSLNAADVLAPSLESPE
jgi:hypothetical protein